MVMLHFRSTDMVMVDFRSNDMVMNYFKSTDMALVDLEFLEFFNRIITSLSLDKKLQS